MMNASVKPLSNDTDRIKIQNGSCSLTVGEFFESLRRDTSFREFFTRTLNDSRFDSFFFETPGLTKATLGRDFECVLVDGRGLVNLQPDSSQFSSHFAEHPSHWVITFPN